MIHVYAASCFFIISFPHNRIKGYFFRQKLILMKIRSFPVLILFIWVVPLFSAAQILNAGSLLELQLEDGSPFLLYSDLENDNRYYYLPNASAIKLSLGNDGQPEFLMMKYLDEDSRVGGVLLHMLIEWKISTQQMEELNALIRATYPNANVVGPAMTKSTEVEIISSTLGESDQTVMSSKAPVLPGSKSAIAIHLDKEKGELIVSAYEEEQSDLSLIFTYELTFGIKTERGLKSIYKQDYGVVKSTKSWYQMLKNNDDHVSEVLLNDPFFQHQEINFILDFESIELFEDFINFAQIALKKERKDAYDFLNEMVIDDEYIRNHGKLVSMAYARGNEPTNDFQYRVGWSLKGGAFFPEKPDWQDGTSFAITLYAPFKPLEVEFETHFEGLRNYDILRVAVEVKGLLAGKEQVKIPWDFRTSRGVPQMKELFFDEGTDLSYRVLWVHKKKGKKEGEWKKLDEDYVYVEIPSAFKAAEHVSNVPPITIAPEQQKKDNTTTRAWKNYALLFAVNKYDNAADYPELKNPVTDANTIAQELSTHYGFQVEIVENPARTDIRNKIDEYHARFQSGEYDPEGQLFLFFSGHGDFEVLSQNGCFLPRDADSRDLSGTAFQYTYWRPRIDNIPCKHILVAIDACYSGTFDANIAMRSGGGFKRPKELSAQERFIQDFQNRKSRYYLVSGGKEKTPDKSGFTKKILEGLRLNDNDGILSVGQLYENHLRRTRPLPLIGTFGTDEAGSNFLFWRN